MPRIALIHALTESMAPINQAMARDWPQAERQNLLDDTLSSDLARAGRLDAVMTQRFHTLADYAVGHGAQGILFTCSAFGPCIEAVARRHAKIPVLRPNEAMIEAARAHAERHRCPVGLLATFPPTLKSMPAEFGTGIELHSALADGALLALQRGDADTHDRLVADAAEELHRRGCGVIALAQFSLARARAAVEQRTGLTVLTTPDTAVARLRERLAD